MKWLMQHKNLSMAAGTFLAGVLLLLVGVIPLYQNTSSLMSQIKVKTSERDALGGKVSILSQLDTNVLEQRVQTLDMALPPKKDVLLYLTTVDGLSRELGLSFGGISLAPGDLSASGSASKKTISSAGLQSLDTDIKVSGSQDSIYAFLRTIEQVLPLMQIKDVKVTVSPDAQYQLSLTLGMLWAEPATADVKGAVTLFTDEEQKSFTQLSQYTSFTNTGAAFGSSGIMGKQDVFAPFTPLH